MLAVFLGTRQMEHTKIVPDSEEPTKIARLALHPCQESALVLLSLVQLLAGTQLAMVEESM